MNPEIEEQRKRFKNRRKSLSAKLAHKRHRSSYKLGTNRMERTKMNNADKESSIQDLIEGLNTVLNEVKIEKNNEFELEGEISFSNIPGGMKVKVDTEEQNVSLSFTLGKETGLGNYKLKTPTSDKENYKALYTALMDDFEGIAKEIDSEIQHILEKHGLASTK